MVRNPKKKALYEVIGRCGSKSGYGKGLEQIGMGKSAEKPVTTQIPGQTTRWSIKPRIIEFNAGRIEISMPYQLAVALLLGIILLVLVVFRLGQLTYLNRQKAVNPDAKVSKTMEKPVPKAITTIQQEAQTAEKTAPGPRADEKVATAESKGSNRIVIQTHLLKTQLEPARQYFAEKGIETEIRKMGDIYYLITTRKYENPEKQGTDGYLARQKIVELGAQYKAPRGYLTFGDKPFHDAYGMKFDD